MLQTRKHERSHMVARRWVVSAGLVALVLAWTPALAQGKGGVLRIGMTAADIPYTGGIPDQGFEGYRFIGFSLYDALINWDLSHGERLASLVPGLAESWEVSPAGLPPKAGQTVVDRVL